MPGRLAIVGGGVVGCELATGVSVTAASRTGAGGGTDGGAEGVAPVTLTLDDGTMSEVWLRLLESYGL